MRRRAFLPFAFAYAVVTLQSVARAASVHDFERPGPYAQPSLVAEAVSVADGGATRESGEVVIQYSATAAATAAAAGDGLPLVVFLFPIHGFPFNAWRNLLSSIIRALCSHGFAVLTPRRIGAGARAISGGLFPGASSTASGMDLREIATRYLNFMTHAVEYVADLATSARLGADVDVGAIGFAGFSVGGALAQYTAQRVDAQMPGRVTCVFAIAPTIGTEDISADNDDVGAQLFHTFAASMSIPTVFVAGIDDRMGGYRDSALYYRDSVAPRVRIVAGSGATHCHAVIPMSECDLALGTRGLDALDGVVGAATLTYYLRRADDARYAAQRAVAEEIIWRDGLREIETSRAPLVPANQRWTVDAVERAPEIAVRLNEYSMSAPVAPGAAEIIAIVESTIVDGACAPNVSVDAPEGLLADVEQLNAREFAVRVRWIDFQFDARRRGRGRAFGGDTSAFMAPFNRVMQTMRTVSSAFGPRAPPPPRRAVTVTARHGCVRGGAASAVVFVNQPIAL